MKKAYETMLRFSRYFPNHFENVISRSTFIDALIFYDHDSSKRFSISDKHRIQIKPESLRAVNRDSHTPPTRRIT